MFTIGNGADPELVAQVRAVRRSRLHPRLPGVAPDAMVVKMSTGSHALRACGCCVGRSRMTPQQGIGSETRFIGRTVELTQKGVDLLLVFDVLPS